MWKLNNLTPFAADRGFARDRDGAEVWIVAVKGTFVIQGDGRTALADEGVDVCLAPEYRGAPESSSLLYDSDLALTKPGTDVLVNGHAYATGGLATASVDVSIRIGPLTKTLRVFGDRRWESGLSGPRLTPPEEFEKLPIVYERAYGGVDDLSENPRRNGREMRNPVGTGFAMAPEHLIGRGAPNVEYPGQLITSWRQRPPPAGFGPVAPAWQPRLGLAGTHDEAWVNDRQPLRPLDFDERYYQCAPADQQTPEHLRGGEPVELRNLTRDGLLQFALPRAWFLFQTRLRNELVEHHAQLHTVVLEPDHPRVIMVWHTSLPCENREQEIDRTVIVQKERI